MARYTVSIDYHSGPISYSKRKRYMKSFTIAQHWLSVQLAKCKVTPGEWISLNYGIREARK